MTVFASYLQVIVIALCHLCLLSQFPTHEALRCPGQQWLFISTHSRGVGGL